MMTFVGYMLLAAFLFFLTLTLPVVLYTYVQHVRELKAGDGYSTALSESGTPIVDDSASEEAMAVINEAAASIERRRALRESWNL